MRISREALVALLAGITAVTAHSSAIAVQIGMGVLIGLVGLMEWRTISTFLARHRSR